MDGDNERGPIAEFLGHLGAGTVIILAIFGVAVAVAQVGHLAHPYVDSYVAKGFIILERAIFTIDALLLVYYVLATTIKFIKRL